MRKSLVTFFILKSVFLIIGCSVPNLEESECSQARDTAKKYYSLHFYGNAAHPQPSNSTWNRGAFLSKEMLEKENTYLTAGYTDATTFKIGRCEVLATDKAIVQLQLYWRDDKKTTQKDINVEVIKSNDVWLISNVTK